MPQPSCTAPGLLQAAVDVVAGLRRRDPRLLLSATDAEHLAPGVAAWLERDLTPTAVSRALSENLPLEPLIRPAAFLAHRLTAQLPPLPPYRPPTPPDPGIRHPLQNCDGCDHAFRSPTPGRCPNCRSDGPVSVTTATCRPVASGGPGEAGVPSVTASPGVSAGRQDSTPAPVVVASDVGRFFAEVSRPAVRAGVQLTVVFSFFDEAAL